MLYFMLYFSCQSNCEMQKWYSGGKYHLCLFSNQPIKSGEELTFDYSTCANDMLEQSQVCKYVISIALHVFFLNIL